MRARMMAGMVALAAVIGLTAWGHSPADDSKPKATAGDQKGKMDAHHSAACAKVCGECMLECEMMFHHCYKLVAEGKVDHAKPMRVALDCSELCTASAKLCARNSELAPAACTATAVGCELCATHCDKFPHMPEMKACAAKCRECAKSCREMVAHHHENAK